MKRYTFLLFLITGLLLSACGGSNAPEEPATLRVLTYDSFSISEEAIATFEVEHNVSVQFLQGGDAGQMINQAILSRDNPQADVLYGIDNTFLSLGLEGDIFEAYAAENLTNIPADLHLDSDYHVVPTAYGDVCLNYDQAYFESNALAVPQSLKELTQPEYKGLLVVENPASSSAGMAFLIATIGVFGEERYLDFWHDLRENDVLVVDGWDTAYYSEFSGGAYSEGSRPLVVSYATSPAAEVYFSEGELSAPPTGALVTPQTCFRQIEFAGILKGTPNREMAEAFIEFLLSDTFQEDIPLQMWVFPANPNVTLPQVFVDFALEAEEPITLAAERIEQSRKAWITAWTNTVLK